MGKHKTQRTDELRLRQLEVECVGMPWAMKILKKERKRRGASKKGVTPQGAGLAKVIM